MGVFLVIKFGKDILGCGIDIKEIGIIMECFIKSKWFIKDR